jgi:hypothetical protein
MTKFLLVYDIASDPCILWEESCQVPEKRIHVQLIIRWQLFSPSVYGMSKDYR